MVLNWFTLSVCIYNSRENSMFPQEGDRKGASGHVCVCVCVCPAAGMCLGLCKRAVFGQ